MRSAGAKPQQGLNADAVRQRPTEASHAWPRLQALRGFATTTRQDEELLRTLRPEPASHRTACLRLAVQFRLQHKRAIARGYKAADACIATVEASVSGAAR